MAFYQVTRISDGQVVYQYYAPSPVEWDSFPFSEYNHTAIQDPNVVVAPPYAGSWQITKLAFRQRFTTTEKITIELAALDNPAGTMQQRQLSAMLRSFVQDVNVATFIDLKRPETMAGIQQLEAAGLLATGRSAVILTTPPADVELYHG